MDVFHLKQTAASGRKDLERHELVLKCLEHEGGGLKGELKSMETNLEKLFTQYKMSMATICSMLGKRGVHSSPLSHSSSPLNVPGSVFTKITKQLF